jgi:hypothetical protein
MEYLCTRFQENCTLEAVKYRIVFNPYWGNTFYIGGTLYGEWPILIGLKVNEDRNKRDGWHPGVIPLNLYPPYGEKSEISWNWERMKKLAATTQAAGATTSTVK